MALSSAQFIPFRTSRNDACIRIVTISGSSYGRAAKAIFDVREEDIGDGYGSDCQKGSRINRDGKKTTKGDEVDEATSCPASPDLLPANLLTEVLRQHKEQRIV